MDLNDEKIEDLIKIEKYIVEPPSRSFKVKGNSKHNNLKANSLDDKFKFYIFLRQNLDFHENFSIGLIFKDIETGKKILLVRMNGNHGEVIDDPIVDSPHFDFHIHKQTEEELEKGNIDDPKYSNITDKYSSFEEAIIYFMEYSNIKDYEKYFNDFTQNKLF